MPKPSTSPLDGIRVLDLGRVVAAPYAAQLLGDLGADVVKVERPKVGDDVRAYANQGHFLAWNRNKRSITIDLSHADGQALVKRLAEKADVLIENYIPGTMKRFGLDYESLSAANPKLIYCSVSGYGQEGPFAQRGGMDHIFQARGGLMSVLSPEPVRTGIVITDCVTGRDAASAILAALFERTRTGMGQHIDIALIDSVMALFSHAAQDYLASGQIPSADASAQAKVGWAGFLDCVDGKVLVLASRNPWFEGLCRVLGVPDAPKDPRYAQPQARFKHRAELEELLLPLAKRWNKAVLAEALADAGVLAGAVNNAKEAFDDPAVQARGIAVTLPREDNPDLQVIKSPLGLSRTPPCYRRPPPRLGEHTHEILREAGLSEGEIEKLSEAGAI